MKNAIIKRSVLLALFSLVFLFSCKEDKLDTYEDGNNIYFSLQRWSTTGNYYNLKYPMGGVVISREWELIKEPTDSITVAYGIAPPSLKVDTVYIPVSIMGAIKDFDRKIGYVLKPTTTAQEGDFKVLSANIPANTNLGAIAIELYRDRYKESIKYIDFELIKNEDFDIEYKEILRKKTDTIKASTINFRLTVSDYFKKPDYWLPAYYGPFSVKKLFLLIEITGADISFFYSTNPELKLMRAYGAILKRYLADQRAAGNIIKDEDGSDMVSGTSV